ncbi:3529_t:CDS:2 [Acaulospora colombiana]|uniref:3529_t:CDS:1 n=1 Tax=Acaulospora colombiana TaxID=27376 RepID=A0ACA9NTA0_9GLOM|nr:3529_t:CDS:2 [Acaulospora colombiana]
MITAKYVLFTPVRRTRLKCHRLQPEQHQSHQALSPMAIKQVRDVMQETVLGITLVDSIGNYVSIPMNFSRTYEIYFKNQKPPGRYLVEQGEYELVTGDNKMIVRPDTWMNVAQPGLRVEMSMIRRSNAGSLLHCPGLDTSGVLGRVITLFDKQPHLILGFNTFCPVGWGIELSPTGGNQYIVITPTGRVVVSPVSHRVAIEEDNELA